MTGSSTDGAGREVQRIAAALPNWWSTTNGRPLYPSEREAGVREALASVQAASRERTRVLEEAQRRLVNSTEGQEVCFCCGERLTMDAPQQGHAPECDYASLAAVAVEDGGQDKDLDYGQPPAAGACGPSPGVAHFSEGCTCTRDGEDPECPHHGYEAVIARYEGGIAKADMPLRQLELLARPTPSDPFDSVRMLQSVRRNLGVWTAKVREALESEGAATEAAGPPHDPEERA